MRRREFLLRNGALLLCVLLAACAGSGDKKVPPPHAAKSFDDVQENELLLVGKIEVFPPIVAKEQYSLDEQLRNQAQIVFRDELKDIHQLSRYDTAGRVTVALNEHFFVAVPDVLNNYVGATILMRIEKSRHNQPRIEVRAKLPGGMYVTARGDQRRGIYIGTVRYTRDEFFAITKMEVVDQYDQARTEFVKIFGDRAVLRKSLLKPPTYRTPDSRSGQPEIPKAPASKSRSPSEI